MKLTKASSDFINSLRAISSQTVLVGHILGMAGVINKGDKLLQLPSYAVLVFFILSGFVIAYSVSQKSIDYGFKNYFIDRFSRIYITLIPALLLTFILSIIFSNLFQIKLNRISIQLFLCNLTMQQDNPILMYLSNILQLKTKVIGMFGENLPLWSLSIEWWLYMFFGVLYYKSNSKLTILQKIVLLISLPFAIGYAFVHGRASWGLSYIWFIGVLINFLIFKYGFVVKTNLKLILNAFILIVITFLFNASLAIIPFAIFFFLSINYFQEYQPTKMTKILFNGFKLPSDFSFSVYIIHYPVLILLHQLIPNSITFIISAFIISNLLAYLIFIFFEVRHRKFAVYLKKVFVK